eukprot:Pgem_evm1s5405
MVFLRVRTSGSVSKGFGASSIELLIPALLLESKPLLGKLCIIDNVLPPVLRLLEETLLLPPPVTLKLGGFPAGYNTVFPVCPIVGNGDGSGGGEDGEGDNEDSGGDMGGVVMVCDDASSVADEEHNPRVSWVLGNVDDPLTSMRVGPERILDNMVFLSLSPSICGSEVLLQPRLSELALVVVVDLALLIECMLG